MWDFEEMKSVARKIDQGINALEKKIAEPSLLGYSDENDSAQKAVSILDELLKEMSEMDEQLGKYSNEMTEDIHDVKRDCDAIEEFIQEIRENVVTMEEYGREYGYVPPAHLVDANQSQSSDVSQLSQKSESSVLLDIDVQSIQSISPIPLENVSTESWRSSSPIQTPNHELNVTFTTPCSKYPSSSPHFVKPKFNLDETASDRGFTVSSSHSSSATINSRRLSRFLTNTSHIKSPELTPEVSLALNSRRLSRFPTNATKLQTPPEPEISAFSRRLLNKSAVKKNPINI